MKKVYLHQKRRKAQRKRRLVFYNGIICSVMVCSNISFDICMKQVSMKEWRKRFEL